MKTVRNIVRGLLAGVVLLAISSCSQQPARVTLSTGLNKGYYFRLGEQIQQSVSTTVGLTVQTQESQGSRQNLQRLLDGKVDFALVQLDVAMEAMQQGKIFAIALLANEYIHVLVPADSRLKAFADLQGKRVAMGAPGSGIRFTANQLVAADNVQVQVDESEFDIAFQKLKAKQLDAMIYVGSPGASKKLRQEIGSAPKIGLLPIQPALVKYLTLLYPGSYQSAVLEAGTYNSRPPVPTQDTATLSTSTVLVTRPNVDPQEVGLLTWSIISTAGSYAQFYPDLQKGNATELMSKGLLYLHPAAKEVFENGDPRAAWIRYLEKNNDLQSAVFVLIATGLASLLFRRWRRERSKKLTNITLKRVNEIRTILQEHPQQAMKGIDELRQEQRIWFIDGLVTNEIYEQLRQKTQTLEDQCEDLLGEQRKKLILDTLLLLDEWQASLETDPEEALKKLSQLKQKYREMLLTGQVDIEAYIELMELTLMSIMTLAPKAGSVSTIDN